MTGRRWNKRVWNFAAALVLLAVGLLAGRAALPLSHARWCLFMDEKIPFDGVRAILHANSPGQWVKAVADGGDQRYGRIFFNVSALVSALPSAVAGTQGQILATRILQIAALLGAVGLLLGCLLPAGPWRFFGALCLVASAPAEYYLAMPKPEPLQAFCLAVFVGLAAWRRAWKHYDVHARAWPQALKEGLLARVFPRNWIARRYWVDRFESVWNGSINTWDYQWTFAIWRAGGFCVVPRVNLIKNIGAGAEATHISEGNPWLLRPVKPLGFPLRPPLRMEADRAMDRLVESRLFSGQTGLEPKSWLRFLARRVLGPSRGKV